MVDRFLRFLQGYVKISIEGEQLERFLNLCRSRQISLRGLCYAEETKLLAKISLKDFFRLLPIRRKARVHIHVCTRHGLPFFFYRNKKRGAFLAGFLFGLFLLSFLSSRIWNIHVEGNRRNSTPEILAFLEKEGVVHGMAKKRTDCGQIAASLRQKFPDIAWVSARTQGTRLLLTVKESLRPEPMDTRKAPCHLIADKEGVIVSMITRRGVPFLHPGDVCKKGDLLVSGELPIVSDSQEVIRYDYVSAEADILIAYERSYHQEFPLKYKTKVPTGREKRGLSLKIASLQVSLHPSIDENWSCMEELLTLRLTENFTLPIVLGKTLFQEYKTVAVTRTKEQAQTLALQQFQLFEEKLLQRGIRITENNVTTTITPSACITRGTLTLLEKTGVPSPIRPDTVPKTDS